MIETKEEKRDGDFTESRKEFYDFIINYDEENIRPKKSNNIMEQILGFTERDTVDDTKHNRFVHLD